MDLSIISTYRCNSHCSMCNIWKSPTLPSEEISLAVLEKIPGGFDNLNITGGEPTLREDLMDMVDILHPKARKLEISTNGLNPQKLEPIIKKFPDIKIRFSLDGQGITSDTIRGERDGYNRKVPGLLRLKELGGKDLGLAITIQDDNAGDLVELFQFCQKHHLELATSALHNGFQFHKSDNIPYDRLKIARNIENLITAQLQTWNIKNWFRAYLNLGLIARVLGQDRLIPCTAAADFLFIDPWSDVYACNVRPDLRIGNLIDQTWEEITTGELMKDIHQKVSDCTQNCWMVGSARTAMRNPHFTRLPKLSPLFWVLLNRFKVGIGLPIQFEKTIDYTHIYKDFNIVRRESYLNTRIKPVIEYKDQPHYQDKYENR